MDNKSTQSTNDDANQQHEQDVERAIETQSKGEQSNGIRTEQATKQDRELDTRESKGGYKP